MKSPDMFKKSILVVSHPDDEVLWFSSILDKVDEVVICYLDVESNPQWTIGRKQSLSEHPMKNISCLGIDESETLNGANWKNPVMTKFGIEISKRGISDKKYKENYYKLKKNFDSKLKNYCNVFTHNPWGEYGNEEHIQIYRAVKELQEQMKFNVWFPNYCSNISFNLMLKYISKSDSDYLTLKTNKILTNHIESIYKKNGCWTWYEDWKWFNEESFMKDRKFEEKTKLCGHIFPLNMIKLEHPNKSMRISKILRTFTGKLSGIHDKE